jgi:hypothetical protein
MIFQCLALCPLLSDHLFGPSSCVCLHANERLEVIGPPPRFGEFGFDVMQRPLEPSSCGTFVGGFILEAPLYLSRVS